MLKLFYATGTCALASHIALEEAGAEYETVRLDFRSNDQRKPEYLALNPKGRVPALVTDRGILTETPAILVFIAQTFPEAHLAPLDDAFVLAQVQAFNSYLCSTVHVAHAHRVRGYRWVDADDAAATSGDAEKSAAIGRRVFRSDRARDICRPVGDGDQLHDLRSLPLYPGAVDGSRRRRVVPFF